MSAEPTTAITSDGLIRMRTPPDFDKDKSKYKEWIDLVKGYLNANSKMYNSDEKKIGFTLSFMTSGNTAKWRIAKRREHKKRRLHTTPPSFSVDWKEFSKDLKEEFTPINNKGKAGTDLMMIKQGDQSVEAYITDFKIIISWSNIMEDAALIWGFQKGLNPKLVKKVWAQTPLPKTINQWYKAAALQEGYWRRALAIQGLDKVTHKKKKEEKPTKDSGNGMSINRLSDEEQSEHIWKGLCFICHQPGHLSTTCPKRNKNYQPSRG